MLQCVTMLITTKHCDVSLWGGVVCVWSKRTGGHIHWSTCTPGSSTLVPRIKLKLPGLYSNVFTWWTISLGLEIFLNIYFYFVWVPAYMDMNHIHVWCLRETEEGVRLPWNWSCRQLWAAIWVLETKYKGHLKERQGLLLLSPLSPPLSSIF